MRDTRSSASQRRGRSRKASDAHHQGQPAEVEEDREPGQAGRMVQEIRSEEGEEGLAPHGQVVTQGGDRWRQAVPAAEQGGGGVSAQTPDRPPGHRGGDRGGDPDEDQPQIASGCPGAARPRGRGPPPRQRRRRPRPPPGDPRCSPPPAPARRAPATPSIGGRPGGPGRRPAAGGGWRRDRSRRAAGRRTGGRHRFPGGAGPGR